ncbi:MAG: hypothetical protein ACRC92_20585 [Peptostreptococcaceae bacterium]
MDIVRRSKIEINEQLIQKGIVRHILRFNSHGVGFEIENTIRIKKRVHYGIKFLDANMFIIGYGGLFFVFKNDKLDMIIRDTILVVCTKTKLTDASLLTAVEMEEDEVMKLMDKNKVPHHKVLNFLDEAGVVVRHFSDGYTLIEPEDLEFIRDYIYPSIDKSLLNSSDKCIQTSRGRIHLNLKRLMLSSIQSTTLKKERKKYLIGYSNNIGLCSVILI